MTIAAPVIRTARPGDLTALLALEQGFDGDRIARRSMRRLLQRPSALIRVIDSDDDPTTLAAALILLTRSNSRMARIYSLMVNAGFRGQGLGSLLVDDASNLAALGGCTGICLEVATTNTAAISLYRKHGFSDQKRLPNYYEDGNDGIRLCRELAP